MLKGQLSVDNPLLRVSFQAILGCISSDSIDQQLGNSATVIYCVSQ